MTHPMRLMVVAAALLLGLGAGPLAAQATTRPCSAGPEAETPGPACLLASVGIAPTSGPLYWHIDQFADGAAARAGRTGNGLVVDAYGKTWLFTIAAKTQRVAGGRHVALIGPLPIQSQGALTAEYLRSVFSPGQTAPLHVHSGPEAFYAMTGETCLETPDGVQKARGPNNVLMIRAGPPMLLKATGTETRRGFALILHEPGLPPTTLIHDWTPKGLCDR